MPAVPKRAAEKNSHAPKVAGRYQLVVPYRPKAAVFDRIPVLRIAGIGFVDGTLQQVANGNRAAMFDGFGPRE
jgi:hypothetical protein